MVIVRDALLDHADRGTAPDSLHCFNFLDQTGGNPEPNRLSVAGVKCVVQIDASENGEHIGLQEGH
jgi:hypothetical protein